MGTFSDSLDLEVFFYDDLTSKQQERINIILKSWLIGVMSGLFAYDFQLMHEVGIFIIPTEDEPELEDKQLFWSFEKIRCSLDAFNALIQVFLYIHANIAKVRKIAYS